MDRHKTSSWALGIATGILLAGCGTTGEIGGGIRNGPFGITFYGGIQWGATGPENWCGCLYWLDGDGERLDVPAGELVHGNGSGTVPKAAKGFEIELEKCADWEGCDQEDAPPPPTVNRLAPSAKTMQFLGAVMTNQGTVDYRILVSADSRDECRAKRDFALEHLDQAPLPTGVEIANLTVATPIWNGAVFAGMDARAFDDEPISAHVLRVNGQVESVNLGSISHGNGWWEVPHTISTTNLSLGSSMSNLFEVSWTTPAGGTQLLEREIIYVAP